MISMIAFIFGIITGGILSRHMNFTEIPVLGKLFNTKHERELKQSHSDLQKQLDSLQ